MDDYEVPVSDTPDFDLSDTTEFFEVELIELEDDVSDEIPLQEDGDTFQEPEFSESGLEGGVGGSVDVDSTDEVDFVDLDSNLSGTEQVESPVHDGPTLEIPQEEINSQSDQVRSEQILDAEEFISETDHAQEAEADNAVPETTSEQAPEVEETVIEPKPEQVNEDDQLDSKTAPEIIHARDEVRPETLKPNVVYERNGYEYKTDELGRTQLVTGDLNLTEGNRTQLQTEVGHMGVDGDEGGHLIGTRFNGPTDAFNLVPQDANLNRGEWKTMENSWANALSNGQDVNVMVKPVYGDDSVRPKSFEVISQVDGELTYTSFFNRPSMETKGEKSV